MGGAVYANTLFGADPNLWVVQKLSERYCVVKPESNTKQIAQTSDRNNAAPIVCEISRIYIGPILLILLMATLCVYLRPHMRHISRFANQTSDVLWDTVAATRRQLAQRKFVFCAIVCVGIIVAALVTSIEIKAQQAHVYPDKKQFYQRLESSSTLLVCMDEWLGIREMTLRVADSLGLPVYIL